MVAETATKAAVGSENQLMASADSPVLTRIQFTKPKELSKIQANTTTATTSGIAQGSATISRARARPQKRLCTRSAVPRPMAKLAPVTTTRNLSVIQQDCQN